MRIIYATDIHGEKIGLELLLELTTADVYLIAGDLIYSAFYSQKSLFAYTELQDEMKVLREKAGRNDVFLDEYARELLVRGGPDVDGARVNEFLRLTKQAERHVLTKYRGIEAILRLKQRIPIYVIPGNYDIELDRTALKDRDLHRRVVEIGGVRIAGFGGAPVWTAGIPDHLAVRYPDRKADTGPHGEPAEFFRQARPHILLTHNPPLGFFDQLPGLGNLGSPGLRDVLDDMPEIRVVLSGHIHEDWGVLVHEGRVIANPSNFGEVVDANGYLEGGTFFEFEMEAGNLVHGALRKIERSRLCDLIEYRWKDGKLAAQVVDFSRVESLSHRKSNWELTSHARSDPHIPEIVLFNRIRFYFRRFQTGEAEERVEDLRKVVERLAAAGYRVAFDILGSVNFGMTEAESDLDVVTYSFVGRKVVERLVKEAFREVVGDRYKLEVTDFVDLNEVRDSILYDEESSDETQRFVFYRAIGRPVNLRLLRELDDLLETYPDFRLEAEEHVREYVTQLRNTSSQTLSLKKYESRLMALGGKVPVHIARKIQEYLQLEASPEP